MPDAVQQVRTKSERIDRGELRRAPEHVSAHESTRKRLDSRSSAMLVSIDASAAVPDSSAASARGDLQSRYP